MLFLLLSNASTNVTPMPKGIAGGCVLVAQQKRDRLWFRLERNAHPTDRHRGPAEPRKPRA